jgi:hypothetical protein
MLATFRAKTIKSKKIRNNAPPQENKNTAVMCVMACAKRMPG